MKELYWFFGILAALFFIWYATGGPERYLATRAPESTPTQTGTVLDGIDTLPSPYAGSVEIRTSNARALEPQEEYLVLRTEVRNRRAIDMTGWILKSSVTGNEASLGAAAKLPHPGSLHESGRLIIPPGGYVVVITGTSPIGTSFQLNKCVGYLEQFQTFSPSLPQACPSPESEFERFANVPTTAVNSSNDAYDLCLEFVEGLSQCTLYHDELAKERPTLHASCMQFLDTYISYPGCVTAHEADPDFYENEWRIYLERTSELWRDKRETIQLLDSEGHLVDTYTY